MTAGFDAMRGTDQRFSDALSGADGTGDPAVMMPVLDVYPDPLSAPMPSLEAGSIPVVIALAARATSQPGPGGPPPNAAAQAARTAQTDARIPPAARAQTTSGRATRPAQPTR